MNNSFSRLQFRFSTGLIIPLLMLVSISSFASARQSEEIENALVGVKTEDVDAALLERTKSNLKYGFAMSIDTPGAIARSLSHYVQLTGDPESINRLYALYDKVTIEDIRMVANKYFKSEHLTIATISDDEQGALK